MIAVEKYSDLIPNSSIFSRNIFMGEIIFSAAKSRAIIPAATDIIRAYSSLYCLSTMARIAAIIKMLKIFIISIAINRKDF